MSGFCLLNKEEINMDLDIVLDNDKRFIARCAAVIYNKS
mgnify:CR=1 FL=1